MMSASEISGYLQIILGIAGIVLTLTNIQRLIPDIEHFTRGKGAPPELDNVAGFARLYIVLFLLVLMMFLICFGLSVTASTLYKALGAKFPLLSSTMTIVAIVSLSLTVTLASFRNRFWVPGIIGTLASAILAVVSAVNPEINAFWSIIVISTIIFLIVGCITAVAPYMNE